MSKNTADLVLSENYIQVKEWLVSLTVTLHATSDVNKWAGTSTAESAWWLLRCLL